MNHKEDQLNINQIKEEEDALDQSLALNRIVTQLLKTKAQENRRLWIALVLSILINLLIVGGFLWYESQWDQSVTTTTEIQQDSEETGSNMLQIGGDNSKLSLDPEEVNTDGKAISEDNNNQNSQP